MGGAARRRGRAGGGVVAVAPPPPSPPILALLPLLTGSESADDDIEIGDATGAGLMMDIDRRRPTQSAASFLANSIAILLNFAILDQQIGNRLEIDYR